MKAQYRVTENDYADVARFHAWRHFITRPPTVQLVANGTAWVMLGVFLWTEPSYAIPVAWIVAGLAILLAIALFVLTPHRARTYYRQYKAIQEPITAELLEAGIKFSTADGEGILTWSKILQWRQNDQFILIYAMPILYYIVPKSIGREGFDVPLLLRRLTEHVGPER